jgi:hypothetical protein
MQEMQSHLEKLHRDAVELRADQQVCDRSAEEGAVRPARRPPRDASIRAGACDRTE